MGNRAVVRFPDDELSKREGRPVGIEVYLHWDADNVVDWLKKAAPRMRKGSSQYAAARFIGFCHEQIEGGLSLGVLPLGTVGDGVIFSVDCDTGEVEVPSGFGQPFNLKLGQF